MSFEQYHPMQVLGEYLDFGDWMNDRTIENILDLGCGRGGMADLINKHSTKRGLVVMVDKLLYPDLPCGTFVQCNGHEYQDKRNYDAIFVDLDYCNEKLEQDFHRFSPKLNPGGFIAFHDIDPRHPLMQTAPCDYLKLCHSTGWEHVEFIAPGDTPGIDYNNRNELWEMGRLLMNDPEAYRKKYNMLGLPKRLGGIGVLIKP